MILLFFIFSFLFLAVLFLFASPEFSPIPYFPSNPKDMKLIIGALDLKNNQTIIDLGAGDGIVIFNAAKKAYEEKLNTQFVAVDINPILVLVMNIRRLFHPNRKNIYIVMEDMFKDNFKLKIENLISNFKPASRGEFQISNYVFYLYISPWLLNRALKVIKQYDGNKNIVSYFYAIKSLKEKKKLQGIHSVYLYNL